jgi:hypothetical protein
MVDIAMDRLTSSAARNCNIAVNWEIVELAYPYLGIFLKQIVERKFFEVFREYLCE